MSNRLPTVTGNEAIKAFQKAGWVIARQKGSHVTLKKIGMAAILTIPEGKSDLKKGLLDRLIELSGLTVDEFINLL